MDDTSLGLTILFNVGGSGEASLHSIGKEIDTIASKAAAASVAMTDGKGSKPGLSDSIDRSEASMAALELAAQKVDMVFRGITSIGESMVGFGTAVVGGFASVTGIMLDQMGEVETSLVRIMSLGNMSRQAAMDTAERTLDLATALPGSIRDMTTLTANLMEAGIDVNKVYGTYQSIAASMGGVNADVLEMTKNLGKESQRQVTVASGIVDLAASLGETGSRFKMFQQLMAGFLETGNVGRIRNRLNLEARETIKAAGMKSGKWDVQDATEGMMQYLMKSGKLGTGALMAASWEGIKEKFADMPTFMARMIGGMPGSGGPFDMLVKKIYGVQTEIINAFEDPKFIESARKALQPVIDAMAKSLEFLAGVIRSVFNFIKDNPSIVRLGISLLAVAGVVSIVTGAFLVLVGVIGSFIAGAALISVTVGPALLGIIPLLLWIVGGLAAIAATTYVVYSAFQNNFAGIKEFAIDVVTVITGIIELIENLGYAGKGTSALTEETFEALNARGLLPFFRNLEIWGARAITYWEVFRDKMSSAWDSNFGPRLSASFDKVSAAVGRVFTAVIRVVNAFGLFPEAIGVSSTDAATSAGKLADDIIYVIDLIVGAVGGVSDWIDSLVGSTEDASINIVQLGSLFLGIWNMVMIVANAFEFMGGVAMIALSPVVALIAGLTRTFGGLVEAITKVSRGDWSGAVDAIVKGVSSGVDVGIKTLTTMAGAGGAIAADGLKGYMDRTDAAINAKEGHDARMTQLEGYNKLHPGASGDKLDIFLPQEYPATWNTPLSTEKFYADYPIAGQPRNREVSDARYPLVEERPTLPQDFRQYMQSLESEGKSDTYFRQMLEIMRAQEKEKAGKAVGTTQIVVQSVIDSRVVAESVVSTLEEGRAAGNGAQISDFINF